jgi:carbonic anhydrase/acetyltransferase-like protein (isoleucine patch superfamily)
MQEPFFGALDGHRPRIAESAFVAPVTVVLGRLRIGALQCTVRERAAGGRGDRHRRGHERAGPLDDARRPRLPGGTRRQGYGRAPGHRARASGEDDELVGMGAILLNGGRIGSDSVIAAGAVVTLGTEIAENSLVVGLPAKVVREVRDSDRQMVRHAFES